jgi:Ribosomal protein L21e
MDKMQASFFEKLTDYNCGK